MINNNNNNYGMYISRKLYKYIICLNIYIYLNIMFYSILDPVAPRSSGFETMAAVLRSGNFGGRRTLGQSQIRFVKIGDSCHGLRWCRTPNVKKISLVFFVASFFCKFEVTRVQMQPKEILDDFPSLVVSSDRISMFKTCFLWISWSHTERSRHQLTDGKLVVLRLSPPHNYEVLSWFRSRGCNQGLW